MKVKSIWGCSNVVNPVARPTSIAKISSRQRLYINGPQSLHQIAGLAGQLVEVSAAHGHPIDLNKKGGWRIELNRKMEDELNWVLAIFK